VGKIFRKVVRSYKAGDVIFPPAGPVDMELVKLGPGSMFGEMGMLDQTKRDASVKALEYSEVLVITPDMFEDQMKSLPAWVVNFIKILISRLRITNEKLVAAQQRLEGSGLLVHGESSPALESVPAAAASQVTGPGAVGTASSPPA
jgi:CRP-like cAMP-binding protein